MKNLKTTALGIILFAMAIGFSAFKSVESQKLTGDFYGNTSSGVYVRINNPYNSLLCQNTGTTACAYRIINSGAMHVPESFTAAQAQNYLDEGWIEPTDSKKGLYTGL